MAARLVALGGFLAGLVVDLLLGRWRRGKAEREDPARRKVISTYLVDNSSLGAYTEGLGYRISKRLFNLDTSKDSTAPWGSTVVGVDQGDGWVRVGDRFLPIRLYGVTVLVLKEVSHLCQGEAGKVGLPRSDSSCSTGIGPGEEDDSPNHRSPSETPSEFDCESEGEGEGQQVAAGSSTCFWAGAHRIGKAEGCEDAFFVTPFGLGVADGVGSITKFARHGVDAAAYAAELMEIAERTLRRAADSACSDAADIDAAAALIAAEREAKAYGAATITVAQLRGRSVNVANLGDSGFMLLRREGGQGRLQIVSRSREQQHDWNFPFQLERFPPALMRQVVTGHVPDCAEDCEVMHVEVMPGDLALLFTDGFSDNLFDEEAIEVVERVVREMGHQASPAAIAQELARAAYRKSLAGQARVPFCANALKHGYRHLGGKPDDITVAAAWVTARHEAHTADRG